MHHADPAEAFDGAGAQARKTCFVLLPNGTATLPPRDGESAADGDAPTVDFDEIYQTIIEPAVEAAGLMPIRSGHINRSGLVQKEMVEQIIKADVALIDVSCANAHVYYQLGVRHTVRRAGTVVMRHERSGENADIGSTRVITYGDTHADRIEQARTVIEASLRNTLLAQNTDSLVHTLIGSLKVARTAHPLNRQDVALFTTPGLDGKVIGYVTGDIADIDFVDLWVNPENTKMQMARLHDDSVSACMRYHGARKSHSGSVTQDTIADELERLCGRHQGVEPGTVVVTGSGELARSNNVRGLLHVAVMHGEPTKGYQLIRNYAAGLTSALKEAERLNATYLHRGRPNRHRGRQRSLLVPLFGTRSEGHDPQSVVDNLMDAVLNYMETVPQTAIRQVYFLAYTDLDRELLQGAVTRARLLPVRIAPIVEEDATEVTSASTALAPAEPRHHGFGGSPAMGTSMSASVSAAVPPPPPADESERGVRPQILQGLSALISSSERSSRRLAEDADILSHDAMRGDVMGGDARHDPLTPINGPTGDDTNPVPRIFSQTRATAHNDDADVPPLPPVSNGATNGAARPSVASHGAASNGSANHGADKLTKF